MFVAKDENGELRNPENVPILVRLSRGRKMIEMLGSGTYRNKKEIADMFGMSLPNVSRTIRSAFLSRGPLWAASPSLRDLPSELRSSAHRHRRQSCLRRDPVHALRSAFGYPQKRIRFFGGYAVSDKLISRSPSGPNSINCWGSSGSMCN